MDYLERRTRVREKVQKTPKVLLPNLIAGFPNLEQKIIRDNLFSMGTPKRHLLPRLRKTFFRQLLRKPLLELQKSCIMKLLLSCNIFHKFQRENKRTLMILVLALANAKKSPCLCHTIIDQLRQLIMRYLIRSKK